MMLRSLPAALAVLALFAASARAQTTDIDVFKDGPDQAKVHVSGFACPLFIGHFERDAFGERDPSAGSDFCAYSALDGVYGTITLTPLKGPFDPKAMLAPEFTEQEGTGGKLVGEKTVTLGAPKAPIVVYERSYQTAVLESDHYRILFTVAQIGNWALEATMEYVTPRDDEAEQDFLNAVYSQALGHIAKLPLGQPAPVLAAPGKPR